MALFVGHHPAKPGISTFSHFPEGGVDAKPCNFAMLYVYFYLCVYFFCLLNKACFLIIIIIFCLKHYFVGVLRWLSNIKHIRNWTT